MTPVDLITTADGQTVIVALGRSNQIAFVDAATRQVERYVLVGNGASGLALSPDEERLYVTNGLSDDISVIDMSTRRNVSSIATGRSPHSVVAGG